MRRGVYVVMYNLLLGFVFLADLGEHLHFGHMDIAGYGIHSLEHFEIIHLILLSIICTT